MKCKECDNEMEDLGNGSYLCLTCLSDDELLICMIRSVHEIGRRKGIQQAKDET